MNSRDCCIYLVMICVNVYFDQFKLTLFFCIAYQCFYRQLDDVFPFSHRKFSVEPHKKQ